MSTVRLLALSLLFCVWSVPSRAQVPHLITYQGRVSVGAVPFTGTGQFKFALVDGGGSTTYWSNDGSSSNGSEPAAAVSLAVTNGLYSIALGEAAIPNMTAIPPSVFTNEDVRLRVWFNNGTAGSQLLSPDQRITAVGYAMMAANVPNGAIGTAQLANGAVGSNQLAPGAVQGTNIAAGAVGSTQLANGAVGAGQIANGAITATQMADGAITPDKLAKPVRTGAVPSSALEVDPTGVSFSVPFSPAFGWTPNVTLTMDAPDGSAQGKARLSLTSRSSTQFTGRVTAGTSAPLTNIDRTPVDPPGDPAYAGTYCSMANVDGNPAISYFDASNGDLKYIRESNAEGTSWNSPVTLDSQGTVGLYTSLAVVNGKPAVSYYDQTNGDLKYVRAMDSDGTAWNAPITLDSIGDAGTYTSLAIVNGRPAISYGMGGGGLKFVRAGDADGVTWGSPSTVDSSSAYVRYIALAVVNGSPAMVYQHNSSGQIKYVRANDASGANWGAPVVPVSASYGAFLSLVVINGNPAFSYQEAGGLKYVRSSDASGSAWGAVVTLDSASYVGRYASLAVVDGNPAVAYYDDTQGSDGNNAPKVRYVRSKDVNGTSWDSPVVADYSYAYADGITPLVVINGKPAICFSTGAALKVVHANDAVGTAWAQSSVVAGRVDTGNWTSMAIVGGNPAIAYTDETSSDLKYVRATDSSGQAWSAPVQVEYFGYVGEYCSMGMVDGNPAISYYDRTNRDLKYVRATDAFGTAWAPPVTVDSSGDVGQLTSLAVVNGKPAISYRDATSGRLKYVRANDVSGATWGSPVTLDACAGFTTLLVVNGKPAIGFRADSGARYVRANDADGAEWPPSSGTGLNSFVQMTIVNGRPAILGQLDGYVRANDADGASWGTVVPLVPSVQQAELCGLAVVNGLPAALGRLSTTGALVYQRAVDVNGVNWSDYVQIATGTGSPQPGSFVPINDQPAIAVSFYGSRPTGLTVLRVGAALPFTVQWMALEP